MMYDSCVARSECWYISCIDYILLVLHSPCLTNGWHAIGSREKLVRVHMVAPALVLGWMRSFRIILCRMSLPLHGCSRMNLLCEGYLGPGQRGLWESCGIHGACSTGVPTACADLHCSRASFRVSARPQIQSGQNWFTNRLPMA